MDIETGVEISMPDIPTTPCECSKCPCLMRCGLFEIVCEYCGDNNHQESGTTGASQFADEVQKSITVQK